MNKILFIANNFPPKINGGNIRVYKFCKFLLQQGWEVHLICNSNNKQTEINAVEKLSKELKGLKIYDTPSLIKKFSPSVTTGVSIAAPKEANSTPWYKKTAADIFTNLSKYIVPDINKLTWINSASKIAAEVVERENIPYVVTSSPLHSTQLIGLYLKEKFGDKIKWIADFRDLWSLSHVYQLGLAKRRNKNRKLEKEVLQAADRIVFVSNGIRNMTINEFKDIPLPGKTKVITNGFDEDDFLFEKKSPRQGQQIIFSYVGTMFGPQAHHQLIEGMGHFIDHLQMKAANVRFDFLGEFSPEVKTRVTERWIPFIHFLPPANHTAALAHMYNADILILLLPNSEEGKVAFSGKFFEYLKIGRPILALVPENGEVANIVLQSNLGKVVPADDAILIGKSIAEMISNIKDFTPASPQLLKQFSRQELTNELIQLIHPET